jgi:hypothetical protein
MENERENKKWKGEMKRRKKKKKFGSACIMGDAHPRTQNNTSRHARSHLFGSIHPLIFLPVGFWIYLKTGI